MPYKRRWRKWSAAGWKDSHYTGGRIPVCFWCGDVLPRAEATVDHVVPLANQGSNHCSNLRLACRHCQNFRSLVTSLWARLHYMGMATRLYGGPSLERWRAERDRHYAHLVLLRGVYLELLDGGQLRLCLAEVDEVLEA